MIVAGSLQRKPSVSSEENDERPKRTQDESRQRDPTLKAQRTAELAQQSSLAAGLLILGTYLVWTLVSDRNRIETIERDRLTVQAQVVDRNLGRQLDAVNNALVSLQNDLPQLLEKDDGFDLTVRRLRSLTGAMPGVRTLYFLNRAGIAIVTNRKELTGNDYHERTYFEIARKVNDPKVLHVSSPIKTARGTYSINLQRSLIDGHGNFSGLVGAALDTDYFSTLLGSVVYAPDMTVSLVHADGSLFVVVPTNKIAPGSKLAKPGSLFQKHLDSGQMVTFYTGKGMLTGVNRMIAQRTVQPAELSMDDGIIVAVARDLAAVFAPWRHEVYEQGSVFGGLVLLTTGTLIFFQRRQRAFAALAAGHAQERERLAFYDPLTGLPNRRLLLDRLTIAKAAHNRAESESALLFIDLDNFKTLNDLLGHHVGDALLQQVAARLTSCMRETDTVARLGGDEFVVILQDLSGNLDEAAAQVEAIGQKIFGALGQPYAIAGHELGSTPSIGATMFADPQTTGQELLRRADFAMYQAKSAGRNCLRFFDPEMQKTIESRVAMEAELRHAIREDQLRLYFQCQVDETGRIDGAEALVRWLHPERGMVLPGTFIPLAEESGIILPLGQWVLEAAFKQIAQWADHPQARSIVVAVNVSARQFHQEDFVDQILALVRSTGADPRKIKLELTESMLVDNVEDIIVKMTALKNVGFSFSLDDFGTGYSSLSYLKRLPLSQLKIDQSFVRDVLTDPNDAVIARTIVALGRAMGLMVIAEGVESEAQRDFLFRNGCLAYQGFLFGRPIDGPAFVDRLARV